MAYDCVINSLLPSDAIWWHKYGWTLAKVMAYRLLPSDYYLNLTAFLLMSSKVARRITQINCSMCHDDVIFPQLRSSVRGIGRSPVDSLHRGSVMRTSDGSLILARTNCWRKLDWPVIGDAIALMGHHCTVCVSILSSLSVTCTLL